MFENLIKFSNVKCITKNINYIFENGNHIFIIVNHSIFDHLIDPNIETF